MKNKHSILSVIFILFAKLLVSQSAFPDTVKIDFLINKSAVYSTTKPDSALYFANEASDLSRNKDEKRYSIALRRIGMAYCYKGDYISAFDWEERSLESAKKINFKQGIAGAYTNLGEINRQMANYPISLDYSFKALKIGEAENDQKVIAGASANIGSVLRATGDLKKALEYTLKSMAIYEKNKNEKALFSIYGNIGVIYEDMGDLGKAISFLNKSLDLSAKINNIEGTSSAYSNLGNIYGKMDQIDKSLGYHFKGLELKKQMNNLRGEAFQNFNIAGIYFKIKNYNEAKKHALNAIAFSKKIHTLDIEYPAHQMLYDIYKMQNNPIKALQEHELYTRQKDSVFNEKSKIELSRKEMKFSFDKKIQADSIKNIEFQKIKDVQLRLKDAEIKNQKYIKYGLLIGILIFIMFFVFLFNRFKITQKQKKIIENQKQIVELKQKEIIDSFHYAKRIQRSLMPSEKYIEKHLNRLTKNKED
jgi:tetratricopeptide (TPR) repeat protein